MNTKIIIAVVVIALLGVIGFSYYGSSQSKQHIVASQEDKVELNNIVNQWEQNSEEVRTASATAKPAVVKDMQSLRDKANNLEVTPCLAPAKESLLVAMDSEIASYQKLMLDTNATIGEEANSVYKAIEKYHDIADECTA